jgi:hypothetical protein
MRASERDERLVAAAEAQARASRALAESLGAQEARERERERRAEFPRPFRLLAGPRGVRTMARAFPGYAGLWGDREVPARYLREARDRRGGIWVVVSCLCGAQTVLEEAHMACVGDCGRWFLPMDSGVLVYRPEEAA